MAKKRIMNLAVEGSRADLVSGNFIPLDGLGGTKKIPAYFVRGDMWVFNCPYSPQLGDYTWPDWGAVQDALNGGFNVALRLYAQGQFNFYVCTGRTFEINDQEETLSVYEFLDISSGITYVIKYNNDTETWGTPTSKVGSPSVLWNTAQALTDPQKLQARNNIGAAALASLAASFESRAPSYNWSANEVCTYGGALWMFDANHSGAWTGADAHETNLMEVLDDGAELVLSKFLNDFSDTSKNTEVLQKLVNTGKPVFIDVALIELDDSIQVSNRLVLRGNGQTSSKIYFPNGKGFVWGVGQYSTYNKVSDIEVEALDNAFELCGDDKTKNARNVYFSKFNNLVVKSTNANCFYASGNKGYGNDTCCFNDSFEDIVFHAPNGCGFVGFSGNTISFERISCYSAGVASFYNCGGYFNSVNGVWGSSSPTFYKARRNIQDSSTTRFHCIFENCNVESYQGILFDCYDSIAYCHIEFRQCTFYITPNSNNIIDFFPFDFFYLYDLTFRACNIFVYNNGDYDSSHCLFRVYQFGNSNLYQTDRDLTINYSSTYFTTIKKNSIYVSRKFLSTTSNKAVFTSFENLSVDFFKTSGIMENYKDVTISSSLLDIFDYTFISPKGATDAAGDIFTINGFSGILGDWNENYNRKIYIKNKNNNALIKILNGQYGGASFFTHTKAAITLNKNDVAECILVKGKGIFVEKVYSYSSSKYVNHSTTSNRPTLSADDEGYQYYDTTLKKMILWNGTDWVNFDGSSLA